MPKRVNAGEYGDVHSKRLAETYDEWKDKGTLDLNEPPDRSAVHE